MPLDWQLIGLLSAWSVNLLALAGVYHGLKADNAKLAADLALSLLTERTERQAGATGLKSDLVGFITTSEKYIDDLSHRIVKLESGQDEWTKTLRDRTHELANSLQVLALKIDRLERPRGPELP
jgi:hypothetical protein